MQDTTIRNSHITEVQFEGQSYYMIKHIKSGIGAIFDHNNIVLDKLLDMLNRYRLTVKNGKLYFVSLKSNPKNIMLNKVFYRIYNDIKPDAELFERITHKNKVYIDNQIEDCRKTNLVRLGKDKVLNTKARKIDRIPIGSRNYIRIYLKKYNRTLYFDDIPEVYDLLQDTKLCYLVSNLDKVQASIDIGNKRYIPHIGQIAFACYQGVLTEQLLNQSQEIINKLIDNKNQDIDHLIEDRDNCTRFNLSLMDSTANVTKGNFFGKFYEPWRIYGAYNPDTGRYLIELALIDSIDDTISTSWFFKCKDAETLVNWIQTFQGRAGTIFGNSPLNELYFDYCGERWAFPTPWARYKQVVADYKQCGCRMPKAKRDTLDDIIHQQKLVDMDNSSFAEWTVLQPNPSVIDFGKSLSVMFGKPVKCHIEQVTA